MATRVASPVEREGLTVDEAATIVGIGRVSVYKLIRNGELKRIKIGSRTIILRSEVERFLTRAAADDDRK